MLKPEPQGCLLQSRVSLPALTLQGLPPNVAFEAMLLYLLCTPTPQGLVQALHGPNGAHWQLLGAAEICAKSVFLCGFG